MANCCTESGGECSASEEKFSTSALLENVAALNSLKLTVKKLRVESGAARIQPWSSENYSGRPKFPNLPRFSYDSVVSVACKLLRIREISLDCCANDCTHGKTRSHSKSPR